MLMTGVDHHRNGVGNMPETMPAEHEGRPGYEGVLNDRSVTLATTIRDNGYHTYITGKWHLGKAPHQLPGRRGFERSFIQADSASDNWEHRAYMMLYDQACWFEQDQAVTTLPKDFYSSQFVVDKAIDFIAANRSDGKPFFSHIGFQANHIPLQAPKAFVDKYKGRYDAGWTALREERRAGAMAQGLIPPDAGMARMKSTVDWDALSGRQKAFMAQQMEVYAGMAEAMDFQIGRLVAALAASGQLENTIFVFLSDNGSDPADPLNTPLARQWTRWSYVTEVPQLGDKGALPQTARAGPAPPIRP